jgi:hypothetical protein
MSFTAPQSNTKRPERGAQPAVVVLVGRAVRPVPRAAAPRTWLALTWSLSRAAAATAGLVPVDGDAEPILELRVPWGPGGQVHDAADVRARVLDGPASQELTLEAVRPGGWMCEPGTGLHHLDLPGLAQVSARIDGRGVAILYARTEVLGRLGLAGGRYDFGGAAIITDPA